MTDEARHAILRSPAFSAVPGLNLPGKLLRARMRTGPVDDHCKVRQHGEAYRRNRVRIVLKSEPKRTNVLTPARVSVSFASTNTFASVDISVRASHVRASTGKEIHWKWL